MGKRIRRILLIILGASVVIIAIAGSINQAIKRKTYGRNYTEGKLYELEKNQIYAEVGGNPEGVPIVFVAGLGDGAYSWCTYTPLLQNEFQTITFDKGGTGRSGAPSFTDRVDGEAYELKALLKATEVEGPYILAGHSLGGATVRRFTQLFPEMVRGVILIDTTNEVMFEGWEGKAAHRVEGVLYYLLKLTNFVGFPRLLHDIGAPLLKREIDDQIIAARGRAYLEEYNEYCFRSSYIASVSRQFRSADKIFRLITKELVPQEIPAYIIYEVPSDEYKEDTEADVANYIAAIRKQYPVSESTIVYDAGHYIHVTRPEVITEGIDWILNH